MENAECRMSFENITNNKHVKISSKSEEVQDIIDRMPTYWTKWITLCVSILIGIIIILSFLIKYPDTIDGIISITGGEAPVRLVAKSSGRIHLLQSNNQMLKKGDVISYIETGANYKHILLVDSLLGQQKVSNKNTLSLPDTLLLGEISTSYNNFFLSYSQYERLLKSDVYATMRLNLGQQIVSDELIITNYDKELDLKNKIIENSRIQLEKDSVLFSKKGISELEYQQRYTEFLALQEAKLNIESNKLLKYSEINRNKLEIQHTNIEEIENKEKVFSEFCISLNELSNVISIWKERYLQCSPIDGIVEYSGFWRNNSFVQTDQELFSVIPDKNNILGEVMIPSYGAGKVEVGQIANVKIDNYPYDEYGLLKGYVKSISRIVNKIQTPNGTNDTYLVIVSFPDGTVTNYGQPLVLDFETKGIVEIVTKPKRLIERLFDNLKTKTEN